MTTLERPETAPAPTYSAEHTPTLVVDLPIDEIQPSLLNPRRRFDEAALAELAESLRTHGLLEPIVVRPLGAGLTGPWAIVAGERRWRAAKLAGLPTVAARILEGIDDKRHLELALLENLQREDLDPIETAAAYQSLATLGYKQNEIAATVKRGQPAIAKSLSLLTLPGEVQDLIRERKVSPTHGAVLAARFRAFPRVATALAQLAAEGKVTAHELEGSLPAASLLDSAGVVKRLEGYNRAFDLAICQTCPFDARRKGDAWGDYCLKPSHYEQLQREADAERRTALAASVEKAKATSKGALLALKDLPYDSYVQIYSHRMVPAGCSAECPCRGAALDYDNEPVVICTNPKRYKGLEATATRARTKDARVEYKERMARLHALLRKHPPIGRRDMALVVAAALRGLQPALVREAAQEWAPQLAGEKLTSWDFRDKDFAKLADLSVLDQLYLALDALIRQELHSRIAMPDGKTPWFDWYVGDEGEQAGEASGAS